MNKELILMKKLCFLFWLLVLVLFVAACSHTQEPKTTTEAVISQLSKEEFDNVGTTGLNNPKKDDFLKFTFNFEVEHAANITRKVEFPKRKSWKEAVNSIDDKDRFWFGEGYEENSDGENFARYKSEFVFYSKGLNEEEIRKAFNSITLKLYLDIEEGETFEKEYKVSDLVKFNNNQSS
ncbi:fructose-bisphosphate aldolase [Virgibacillus subterraneus]|nr:fructose-bisphosphate aldolase [Virgibacillus subterraneus]